MPVNKNAHQQETEKGSTTKREPIVSRVRKAPGTRFGTLSDWRQASDKSGAISGSHGHAIRDGR